MAGKMHQTANHGGKVHTGPGGRPATGPDLGTRRAGAHFARLAAGFLGERGAATIEFVIIFPVLFAVFASTLELGLYLTRQVMLDRAVDMTVRAIRLTSDRNVITHDSVKKMICDNIGIVRNCTDAVRVRLDVIDTTTWQFPTTPVTCVDRREKIQPVITLTPGQPGDIMLMSVCMVVDPIFPGATLGLRLEQDASGGVAIFSRTAFVNEPR